MHISRVELENIKSHASATFEFTRGTTAITGENGAGKTTIIEAIAWALFDLLEYKKEEFVRRGAKKGTVRVTFESGLDEREYVVYRDSGAGYHVTDPRLQTRIADKKEEVFRFLWQHLGLEPGTDLRSLFRQAIGVPQGTFTAIFLEGATERKVAFDRLLKVEEYRQAAEKLRETSRFLDARVAGVREGIARAEGELARSEAVAEEHKTEAEQAKSLATEYEMGGTRLAATRSRVSELDAKEKTFAESQKSAEKVRAERDRAELVLHQREQSVKLAADAAARVDDVWPQADRHVEILGRFAELERERHERDRLRTVLAQTDAAIVKVKADQKQLFENIDAIQKAHSEIELLRPRITDQEAAEAEIGKLRDRVAAGRALASQIAALYEKLERRREMFRANKAKLDEAEARSSGSGDISVLESRDAELLRQIANLRAGLERDEKFQSEIKNGLCPILSQKCLNLKPGETLESFVTSQFSEMRSQISVAENEHSTLIEHLRSARQAQQYSTALEGYRQRAVELTEEGQRLKDERATLVEKLGDTAKTEGKLAVAEANLRAIDDPRSRVRFLENETKREPELRSGVTDIERNLERLGNDHLVTVERLDPYKDLDKQWSTLSLERDATAEAYRAFIANEAESKMLSERQTQLAEAAALLAEIGSRVEIAEKELASAASGYDRDVHTAEKNSLLDAERKHAGLNATMDAAKRRAEQLAAELTRFAEIRRSIAGEFKEKERLEKVAEATAFIRDTLKEAAPRVARNYVYHVSLEANLMFREITGNAERTLKWGEDYAIMLEEDGYERPFQSLSGGEQMAAALSVRLALLKQLTDIRIAFFDEPTTNMDAERRENLAMQISRITHFDQLFVISHDETFDSYVDNVLNVGKE